MAGGMLHPQMPRMAQDVGPAPTPTLGPWGSYDAALATVGAQQNPYDTNGAAFKNLLSGQQQQTANQFANAQQQQAGTLGARGMMGQGAEAARRAALTGAAGNAMANTTTQAYADAYNRGGAWQAQQNQMLAGLLGGKVQGQQFTDQLGFQKQELAQRGAEFAKDLQQRQDELQQQRDDAASNAAASFVGGLFGKFL